MTFPIAVFNKKAIIQIMHLKHILVPKNVFRSKIIELHVYIESPTILIKRRSHSTLFFQQMSAFSNQDSRRVNLINFRSLHSGVLFVNIFWVPLETLTQKVCTTDYTTQTLCILASVIYRSLASKF